MLKLTLDSRWNDINLAPHSRAKSFKLKWSESQGFRLSFPSSLLKRSLNNLFMTPRTIEKELEIFLDSNTNWIETYRQKSLQLSQSPSQLFLPSQHPRFKHFQVIWKVDSDCHKKSFTLSLSKNTLRIYCPRQEEINDRLNQEKLSNAFRKLEKKEALLILEPKIREFANSKNLELNNVVCKQMKTRWGSCSSKKNINLNAQIIRLPEALQDYVLWHELAHLEQANHSSHFWNLLEEWYPGAKELDRQLNHYKIEY
jgi:predicted metal-dependent hydrolase